MFDVLYLSLLMIFSKREGRSKSAAFDSFLGISCLQCINLYTIFALLNSLLELKLGIEEAKVLGIGSYLLVTLINYFYLYLRTNIIKEANVDLSKNSAFWFYLYLILTIIIFLGTLKFFVTNS